MIHRQNNVLLTGSDNKPDFAASYTVTALPVGAVAAAASSGSTATVDAGHGFKAGDKVLIYNSSGATFVAEALNSVTGTTLVWSSATPTIAKGDQLCNLGPDSASGSTPAYDASPLYIFSDSDGGDAITSSRVTCSATGDYDYYTNGDGRSWELIRDSGGGVAGVVDGWGGVSGQLNPCDYGCIGDGSTDNAARMKVCLDACAASKQVFRGPEGSFSVGSTLVLKANTKARNDPWFEILKAFNGEVLESEAYSTAGAGASTSDDNIEWVGGRIKSPANTYTGGAFKIHSDYGRVADLYIDDWGTNAGGGIAGHLYGNYGWIDSVRAISTLTSNGGTDGLGRAAGTGGGITNCHVKSADDCYTTSVWVATGPIGDMAVSDIVVANCYGESPAGRLFYIGTATGGATTASVERITVRNITGSTTANNLIRIANGHASDSGSIKNITIDGINAQTNTSNGAFRIVDVDGSVGSGSYQCEDIVVRNVHGRATTSASPVQGQVRFKQVNRGKFLESFIDASGINAAMDEIVFVDDCKNVDINDNIITMSTTQATGTVSAIMLSSATGTTGGTVRGNTIIDLPNNGRGIDLQECTGYTVTDNSIRIASGATSVIGINDGGGTVEGNNVIANNNLYDWLAIEAAAHAAGNDTFITSSYTGINQLNEGDTAQWNNLGHDLVGFETYTAVTGGTQGQTPMRARNCLVTVNVASDDITLPYAIHGREIVIYANGNNLAIHPAKNDVLDGAAADAQKTLASGTSVHLLAINKTSWVVVSGSLT